MRAKTMATMAVLAALALAPATALAGPGGGRGMDGGDGMGMLADRQMNRLMDQLKLTPEQRGKIETIRARHHEQSQPTREELGKKRDELFTMVRGAKATRDQAIAKQREVNALQARLAEARLAAWFEARAVLTPEQLAQLEKMPAGRRGWKEGGKGERGHGRRWGNP